MGTTSACAENTLSRAKPSPKIGNYLRVRGEYGSLPGGQSRPVELPPRARRILGVEFTYGFESGTTSACAENTLNELGLL